MLNLFTASSRCALGRSVANHPIVAAPWAGPLVLLLILGVQYQAWAGDVTPYVVSISDFDNLAVIGDSLTVTQSTIGGVTDFNASSYSINGSTFNGNFLYSTTNPFTGNSSPNCVINGSLAQAPGAGTNYTNAAAFSQTLSTFAATQTINDQNSYIGTISGTLPINVIDIQHAKYDNAPITISGSAGMIFYINVSDQNFGLNQADIILSGGVTANDVVWNILNTSGETQISDGTFNGTILDFGQGLQLGDLTVNGGVYGLDPQIHDYSTINGISAYPSVPEPSTWVGLGAAVAGVVFASSGVKRK